jgi:hypothetical protein
VQDLVVCYLKKADPKKTLIRNNNAESNTAQHAVSDSEIVRHRMDGKIIMNRVRGNTEWRLMTV